MQDATISLADLPLGEWTVIARRVCRRNGLGDWADEFDFVVAEGKDGVRAAREAGALVTVHSRDARGTVVLMAQPVPPKLRPAFAAPGRVRLPRVESAARTRPAGTVA